MTRLLPLALDEWPEGRLESLSLDEAMLRGGYPPLHVSGALPQDWFASYVATYVERDVRQITRVQDLSQFQRFVRLCAGRTGQLLNLANLAQETGVAQATARAWLSILEASDLIHLLPPYHRNFGKRLVKSPKLYFLDVGLACYLLGLRDARTLNLHPLRGALFETLIVSECLKARFNAGRQADLYFWRDNSGMEADLLFEHAGTLQPVEIKSGQTVTADLIRAGQRAGRFARGEARTPWLVYGGDELYTRGGVKVTGWRQLDELRRALAADEGGQESR